jgi:glycosyltransferase involved in cell wall biosynthesis
MGERLRVLMVSKACVVGAYQKKLEELARAPDIALTVVVPPAWREAGHNQPLERAHTAGCELIVEPLAFNGHHHLHFYPLVHRQFRRVRPHVVHIDEEPYNLVTFHLLWLSRLAGARTLFFTWQNLARRYPPPFSLMERYVLARADAAIAGTREAALVLRSKGYRGPLEVIPQFGVDPDLFCPAKQPASAPSGRPFTVGYAGRLVEQKGVLVLVEAFARAAGQLPAGTVWRLALAGSGPLYQAIQRRARELGISHLVELMSHIPSTAMPDFLRSLDVLVLPSLTRPNWKEQFGRVLIEAMACGVPVLGSASGEIPHIIGDAGMTFPEGDVALLAERLLWLYRHPDERRRMAGRGRARVLAEYTHARVAAHTLELYRRLGASESLQRRG